MVVFANTKSDSGSLPAGAKKVRSEAGGTIPMVFVTTADGEEGIQGISYAVLKEDMRDAVRDLKKKLETVNVLGSSAEAEAEIAEAEETSENASGLFAESQAWTNTDGNTITAAIEKLDGDQVVFKMPNGQALSYPLAKLSAESQKKIQEMKAD